MESLYRSLLLFAAVTSSFASFVFDLDANSFDHYAREKDIMLVDFFAPWCAHCKALAPELENAANTLATKNQFVFAKVDCISPLNEAICKKFNVQGYPSLKLFKFGQYSGDYIGGRTSNEILTYMDSVTETSAQKAPLTSSGPLSFAAALGATPQSYVNPLQLQYQQAPHPQAFQVPQPGQVAPTYFNSPLSIPPVNSPSLINSFYNTNSPSNNQPSLTPYPTPNQPNEQAKMVNFHLGPSPDSLAGKFGNNLVALDILRAKLKMIAAYKNWQKRLKEYKEKMVEAAKINPYSQNKGFTKHLIHRPAPAAILKAKAFLRKSKPTRFQKKYPRTYRTPIYRPATAYRPYLYQPASFRRSSVYGHAGYRPQPAAYQRTPVYKQPYSAYKRYYAYKQRQRLKAQQQQQQRREKIQQQQRQTKLRQQQEQRQQRERQQQRQQQQQQQLQQRQNRQRQQQQQDQQEYQGAYSRSFIARPQTQEITKAALEQEENQEDRATITQPKTQDNTDQPQEQAIDDATPLDENKQTLATSDKDTSSLRDLKEDIESAIKDALKTNRNSNIVQPKVVVTPTVGSKAFDLSGSGSGSDNVSGSGDNHSTINHIAVISGSGSGSKMATSGSGSGAALSKKSNDKTSGEE